MTRSTISIGISLGSLALLTLLAAPAAAKDAPKVDLRAWGKLSPDKKSGHYKLTYLDRTGKKAKSKKVQVQVEKATQFFVDRRVQLSTLKKGDEVFLLGRPKEQTTQTPEGRTSTDRQITNTLLVVTGQSLDVNMAIVLPKGLKWLRATVSRAGAALSVSYEGREYRVLLSKRYVVLRRQRSPKRPNLRKKIYAEVWAMKAGEAFVAKRLVVLDKRLKKLVYPLLVP